MTGALSNCSHRQPVASISPGRSRTGGPERFATFRSIDPRSYPSGLLIPSPGMGPSGFAWLPCPLPHRIRSWPPVSRTAVGYQSVGIRPSSGDLAVSERTAGFSETFRTAIALLSASATNSLDSSLERARAFGVLPSEGPAGAASLKYRDFLFLALSENLTKRPLLRNFLHPLKCEEPTLVTALRLDMDERHRSGWFERDAEGAGLRLNWAGHGKRLDEGVGIPGLSGLSAGDRRRAPAAQVVDQAQAGESQHDLCGLRKTGAQDARGV